MRAAGQVRGCWPPREGTGLPGRLLGFLGWDRGGVRSIWGGLGARPGLPQAMVCPLRPWLPLPGPSACAGCFGSPANPQPCSWGGMGVLCGVPSTLSISTPGQHGGGGVSKGSSVPALDCPLALDSPLWGAPPLQGSCSLPPALLGQPQPLVALTFNPGSSHPRRHHPPHPQGPSSCCGVPGQLLGGWG